MKEIEKLEIVKAYHERTRHELLGARDRRGQSSHHFTVSGPLEDTSLRTAAPFAHLNSLTLKQ